MVSDRKWSWLVDVAIDGDRSGVFYPPNTPWEIAVTEKPLDIQSYTTSNEWFSGRYTKQTLKMKGKNLGRKALCTRMYPSKKSKSGLAPYSRFHYDAAGNVVGGGNYSESYRAGISDGDDAFGGAHGGVDEFSRKLDTLYDDDGDIVVPTLAFPRGDDSVVCDTFVDSRHALEDQHQIRVQLAESVRELKATPVTAGALALAGSMPRAFESALDIGLSGSPAIGISSTQAYLQGTVENGLHPGHEVFIDGDSTIISVKIHSDAAGA